MFFDIVLSGVFQVVNEKDERLADMQRQINDLEASIQWVHKLCR